MHMRVPDTQIPHLVNNYRVSRIHHHNTTVRTKTIISDSKTTSQVVLQTEIPAQAPVTAITINSHLSNNHISRTPVHLLATNRKTTITAGIEGHLMPPTVIMPMKHLREVDRIRSSINLIPPTILTRIKRNSRSTEVITTTTISVLVGVARNTTQTQTLVGKLNQPMPIITMVILRTEYLKGTLVKVILGNIQAGHPTTTNNNNSSSLSHSHRTILVANRYRDTTLAVIMLVPIPTP